MDRCTIGTQMDTKTWIVAWAFLLAFYNYYIYISAASYSGFIPHRKINEIYDDAHF